MRLCVNVSVSGTGARRLYGFCGVLACSKGVQVRVPQDVFCLLPLGRAFSFACSVCALDLVLAITRIAGLRRMLLWGSLLGYRAGRQGRAAAKKLPGTLLLCFGITYAAWLSLAAFCLCNSASRSIDHCAAIDIIWL